MYHHHHNNNDDDDDGDGDNNKKLDPGPPAICNYQCKTERKINNKSTVEN
jgi:hypothetical protein